MISEYNQGYVDGITDSVTMSYPVKTQGHTFDFYREATAKYKEAIYAMPPTEYQRGYSDGFDWYAEKRDDCAYTR